MVTFPEDHMLCFHAFLLPPPAAMTSTESYIKELNAVACAINFKSLKFASFSFLLTILKVIQVLESYFSRPSFVLNSSVIWRRQWHPTPVLLPGKSHGWRSLVGCSPWGRWESGTTEWLHFHFSLSCIGEGNGNPLQYSWVENPRDRGA